MKSRENAIKAGRVWVYGGTTLPCSRLSGGRVVDLAAYCRAKFTGRSKSVLIFWVTSQEGRLSPEAKAPACGAGVLRGRPYNLRPIEIPQACAWAAGVGESSWVKWYNKGPRVIATRLRNRRLVCFYIPRARWNSIWKPKGTKPATTPKAPDRIKKTPYRIEFVSASRPRKVLARLRPGLRFIVRLVYRRNPGGQRKRVTLRQLKGGASIRLTAKRVKRTNVFETGVVRLRMKGTP